MTRATEAFIRTLPMTIKKRARSGIKHHQPDNPMSCNLRTYTPMLGIINPMLIMSCRMLIKGFGRSVGIPVIVFRNNETKDNPVSIKK